MDIQTQRERNPPVRNIKRDSIETQTQTELFTNQAGLKTEKESGIHSLHAEDTAEKNRLLPKQKICRRMQRIPVQKQG